MEIADLFFKGYHFDLQSLNLVIENAGHKYFAEFRKFKLRIYSLDEDENFQIIEEIVMGCLLSENSSFYYLDADFINAIQEEKYSNNLLKKISRFMNLRDNLGILKCLVNRGLVHLMTIKGNDYKIVSIHPSNYLDKYLKEVNNYKFHVARIKAMNRLVKYLTSNPMRIENSESADVVEKSLRIKYDYYKNIVKKIIYE